MKSTVVLATYNGESFVYDQINSLNNQTRKIDQVIIFDDKSTDNTVNIISDYINQQCLQSTWKLFVNEKNLGFRNNFKKALSFASNEVIFLCDQDDIWNKNKVEDMMKVHEKIEKNIVLVSDVKQRKYGNATVERIVDEEIPNALLYDDMMNVYKILFTKLNLNNRRPGWAFSFSKEFINETIQILNSLDQSYHDEVLWFLGLSNENLFYLKKDTGIWRRFPSSETSRENIKKNLLFNNKKYLVPKVKLMDYFINYVSDGKKKKILINERRQLLLQKEFIIDGSLLAFFNILFQNPKIAVIALTKRVLIKIYN